jgi:putative DNA primase/helicase
MPCFHGTSESCILVSIKPTLKESSMDRTPPAQSDVARTAAEFSKAGLSVVRVRGDGTKRPEGLWQDRTKVRPAVSELRRQFPMGDDPAGYGVGVVYGGVSGGVLMIEFEGSAMAEGWFERAYAACAEHGAADEFQALCGGWAERSPSGGIHLHVRVTGGACPGNLKIASREMLFEEMDERQRDAVRADPGRTYPKVMIETRGEGGFAVRAPSGGPVHGSGLPYVRVQGGPHTIPDMPLDRVIALLAALHTLNEYTAPAPVARPAERTVAPRPDGEGLTPFDDFDERGDWAELLDGILFESGTTYEGVAEWTRYGKDPRDGHSATIGYAGKDLLYVFSTSVGELPQNVAMSKSKVHTWLTQGAWTPAAYQAAARDLRARGYGG